MKYYHQIHRHYYLYFFRNDDVVPFHNHHIILNYKNSFNIINRKIHFPIDVN
jgi:hypothetical protein